MIFFHEETSKRIITVTSSLNEKFTDQQKNKAVHGVEDLIPGSCTLLVGIPSSVPVGD
jgi:hypothetical protein